MTIARQSFYQQIAQNKRRSWLLMFALGAILMLVGAIIGYAITGSTTGAGAAVVGAFILAILLSAGAWFRGDSLVLAASRAKQVGPGDLPQLVNVVQELSIAAGVPMPRVFIIDDSAPNAFATGRDPAHA
ncbi:MAG: zinc metalloprotease HtpX, partial [Chloroflexi bacterium]|nr:zinc metalloprotease HtpX [Chloroflexota bacterium]